MSASVCLSVCLSVCFCVWFSVCLPVFLFGCLSVCLSIPVSEKPHVQILQNFLNILFLAWPSTDNSGIIHYVLLILWLTSCFRLMGRIARDVGSIDISAMLKQAVKIFSVFTRGRHTFDFVVIYNGTGGEVWCQQLPCCCCYYCCCLKRNLYHLYPKVVGCSSPYCSDMWRRYCCLTSFFSDCRHMP